MEDVIYLADLDIIIYTTAMPKSSTIYLTHTKADYQKTSMDPLTKNLGKERAQEGEGKRGEDSESFKLLATLRGHKNYYPPSIVYVEESGCLISGEKYERDASFESKIAEEGADSPAPLSPKPRKSLTPKAKTSLDKFNINQTAKDKAEQEKEKGADIIYTEILVWNLQRDMIELFQTPPPWQVSACIRFNAHCGSIISLTYLPASQLLVSSSTDGTIRFFDPIAEPYQLSHPSRSPNLPVRPTFAQPSQEHTLNNSTFKEVDRIYTGTSLCYVGRAMGLSHYPNTKQKLSQKDKNKEEQDQGFSGIEWFVALKLNKPQMIQNRKISQGHICGVGIDRVKMEVRAINCDDPVPEEIKAQANSIMIKRRKKAVALLQNVLPSNLDLLISQSNNIRKIGFNKCIRQPAKFSDESNSGII